jgi:uncharacterized protein (TIGR03435 family)
MHRSSSVSRYEIDAVAASPFKEGEYRIMLQALLTERFGLVIQLAGALSS